MRILHVGYGFRPLRQGGVIAYAEDLMAAQANAGHDIAYFFAGRQSPLGRRNRLHRWHRDRIAMHELLNSTLIWGGTGTLMPEADLSHPPSEAAFERVLVESRPDVVHVHELVGLPSSLIEIAQERRVPVVATLQDYLPLCPIIKLYDVDGQRCLRRTPGSQCRRCCASAPPGPRWMIDQTIRHELRERLPGRWGGRAIVAYDWARAAKRLIPARRKRSAPLAPQPGEATPWIPPAESYQARRDTNIARLNRLDALVLQSRRAAEVYGQLGVPKDAIEVKSFTLRHIDSLAPREIVPAGRIRFVALNGCASAEKGSDVVIGALEELAALDLTQRFELSVFGFVAPETRRSLARFPNVRIGAEYESDDLDATLDGFDVGIVPSIWEESYGYVGLELLAKGIPVIGNARGGIVDYTRDGETGWVNQDASANGLATIMADIIARPDQIHELNASILRNRSRIITRFVDHASEIEHLYQGVIVRAAGREPAVAG